MNPEELIAGNGNYEADMFIVADYARKADSTTGKCLSGYYYKQVASLLEDANYRIDNAYLTCIIKRYEKGLGVGSFKQDKKLLELHYTEQGLPSGYYTDLLVAELNEIKPRVIITLGEYALQVLTGRAGITNFRGSVLPIVADLQSRLSFHGAAVVATLHPSVEHNDESSRYLLRMDFEKAIKILDGETKVNDHNVAIMRNLGEWLSWRNRFNPVEMSTDIETRFGFITCTSVCYDGHTAAVLPLTGSKVDVTERSRIEWLIAQDLRDPTIGKHNQNMGYDKRIYERFGHQVTPVIHDTMLAASVIASEFKKNLGFLTSCYTTMSYYKDEGHDFNPSQHSYDQLYEYCGKDAIAAFQIKQGQVRDLEDLGMTEFFSDFMMRLFTVYYNMDSVGILQSQGKKAELKLKYEVMLEVKTIELNAITCPSVLNLNSPSQIGKWMEENGFPVLRHRVDSGFMAVNTDAESMRKMRSASPLEYKRATLPYETCLRFLNLVLLIRRIEKILEYVFVGVHPWGRIHSSYKLGGTTSGRTAAGRTPDQVYNWFYDKKSKEMKLHAENLGASPQTVTKHGFIVEGDDDEDVEEGIIGKDIREMYIPDPGWVIVEIDRSQAEARVVDLLAEDYTALEEYGKVDKHCLTASKIFTEFTYEQILRLSKGDKSERSEEGEYMRQIGKKGAHATNYDMGPYRLSNMANITMAFADQILKKLHAARPQIRSVYHKQVEDMVRHTHQLYNPLGRVRMFFKKLDGHGIKVALAWFPQSTISDSTKRAMLRIADQTDNLKYAFIAENHDSITALVKHGYIRQYVNTCNAALHEGIDFRKGCFSRDYNLIIPTDTTLSRTSWGEMQTMRKIKAHK